MVPRDSTYPNSTALQTVCTYHIWPNNGPSVHSFPETLTQLSNKQGFYSNSNIFKSQVRMLNPICILYKNPSNLPAGQRIGHNRIQKHDKRSSRHFKDQTSKGHSVTVLKNDVVGIIWQCLKGSLLPSDICSYSRKGKQVGFILDHSRSPTTDCAVFCNQLMQPFC